MADQDLIPVKAVSEAGSIAKLPTGNFGQFVNLTLADGKTVQYLLETKRRKDMPGRVQNWHNNAIAGCLSVRLDINGQVCRHRSPPLTKSKR